MWRGVAPGRDEMARAPCHFPATTLPRMLRECFALRAAASKQCDAPRSFAPPPPGGRQSSIGAARAARPGKSGDSWTSAGMALARAFAMFALLARARYGDAALADSRRPSPVFASRRAVASARGGRQVRVGGVAGRRTASARSELGGPALTGLLRRVSTACGQDAPAVPYPEISDLIRRSAALDRGRATPSCSQFTRRGQAVGRSGTSPRRARQGPALAVARQSGMRDVRGNFSRALDSAQESIHFVVGELAQRLINASAKQAFAWRRRLACRVDGRARRWLPRPRQDFGGRAEARAPGPGR